MFFLGFFGPPEQVADAGLKFILEEGVVDLQQPVQRDPDDLASREAFILREKVPHRPDLEMGQFSAFLPALDPRPVFRSGRTSRLGPQRLEPFDRLLSGRFGRQESLFSRCF